MNKRNIGYFTVITLIAAILIGGNYFTQAKAASNESEELSHEHEDNMFVGGTLLTKNRSKMIVCVDNVSTIRGKDVSNDKIVKRIEKQIEKLSKGHKRYKEVNYHLVDVEVTAGCSFTPFLNDPNNSHPLYGGGGGDRVVDQPSEESLGIFIVDQEIIDKNFKKATNRWSPEELICEGHECFEVTKGIYFTPDEIKDVTKESALYQELVYGFGLESMIPIEGNETKQKKDREKKEKEKKEMKNNQL
ncbi:hypothetical protein [Brevibacillus sp. NRS-1366]|uniref:hypothetical protein n=1 Tax=Brevibacillus sp. NRS-1366 TaxID=3233899 RepID=UPI003D1BDB64